MLLKVDRIQAVVGDMRSAAEGYARLLDAAVSRRDRVSAVAARRTVLALGTSEIELLEPDGAGPAADFLSRARGGLFAAGFACSDVPSVRAHLQSRGVDVVEEHGQLFLAPETLGVPGLRAVLSPAEQRPQVGLVRNLYEVTLLVDDFQAVTKATAETFGLEPSHFVPIRSAEFGYDGVLTLFQPDRLHRVEVITPNDATRTMGRFFTKRGACLYMCYAETDRIDEIRRRLQEHEPREWTGTPDGPIDNLFIHPRALGGMMLGLSRTTFAWTWSGHPDWVKNPNP
jgi:hypothetical protein